MMMWDSGNSIRHQRLLNLPRVASIKERAYITRELLFDIIIFLCQTQNPLGSLLPTRTSRIGNNTTPSTMSEEDDGDQLVTKPFKFVTGLCSRTCRFIT